MNETKPTTQDLWFEEDVITQPGQGALYYLSSETVNEIVILDKDGKPFDKPEKHIGFV